MKSKVPQSVKEQARNVQRSMVRPEIGSIDFGDLRRLKPISNRWGFDRGLPVDRHYIESFLSHHSADIAGTVLEFGEDLYSSRFGKDRVVRVDTLDVRKENTTATYIADITDAPGIPTNLYDCVICTQTFQLIYDVSAAIRTLHRILAPGGRLLVTLPGITHTQDPDWASAWCWNFTPLSASRLFGAVFNSFEVEVFGNVLAAISFLQGISAEELTSEELNHRDPGFDVVIAVRAIKDS